MSEERRLPGAGGLQGAPLVPCEGEHLLGPVEHTLRLLTGYRWVVGSQHVQVCSVCLCAYPVGACECSDQERKAALGRLLRR